MRDIQILAIRSSDADSALHDYKPRELASMVNWFNAKESAGYPVLGAFDDDDRLLGFTTTQWLAELTHPKSKVKLSCLMQNAQKPCPHRALAAAL